MPAPVTALIILSGPPCSMTIQTEKYVLFYHGPGSNWFPAPFEHYGCQFANSEQAFVWHKAQLFRDRDKVHDILTMGADPKVAKRLGRQVRSYDEDIWSAIRYHAMLAVNIDKFSQNPDLCDTFLFAFPGKAFVEASPYDTVWGIGLAATDPRAVESASWRGQNLLGKVLDQVRQLLRTQENARC